MASITKEITVDAPIAQVFAFWKNFENFPRFMENIESIQVIGPDLTHWKANGPLGSSVEWDAETTFIEENKKIAWKSTGGSVETHGAVVFRSDEAGGTHVTVGIEYNPPGGAIGEAVAKLFHNPEDQLEEDLRRFRNEVEGGALVGSSTYADGGVGADHTAAVI